MISSSIIISFYTILVVILTFPLTVAIIMRYKRKTKFSPFLLGLVVYFTFEFFFVTMVNSLFLNPGRVTYGILNENPVGYCLFVAVTNGFLVILGMYIAFDKILGSHDDKRTPLMLSLGYVAIALIALVGLEMIVYITNATAINELGLDGYRELYADVKEYDIEATIKAITNMTIGDVLCLSFDLLVYVLFTFSLAIMVFYSSRRKVKAYFWIAILMRALYTIPSSLERKLFTEVSGSWQIAKLMIGLTMAAFAGYIALMLFRSYDKTEMLLPSELFKKKNV